MPATNQWAVSTLIREVLADPDLAGRASSAACSGPVRTGLVDAGADAVRRPSQRVRRRAPAAVARPSYHASQGTLDIP